MTTKRPFPSEGHLRLPPNVAPEARPALRAPFDAAGRTRVVPVPDDRLRALDVCAGDRVLLAEGREPEHGDLALLELDGREQLWRVFPEAEVWYLGDGRARRGVAPDTARVLGVVVGVLRRLA